MRYVSRVVSFLLLSLALTACTSGGNVVEEGLSSGGSESLKIQLDNLSVTEGSSLTAAIILNAKTGQSLTFDWTVSGSGAAADFSQTNGTFVISSGTQSGSFTVTSVDNLVYDRDRIYNVQISQRAGNSSQTIEAVSAQLTVLDNEAQPVISLSSAGIPVTEGTNLSFTAQLSVASTQTIQVSYATSDGTATSANDYTSSSGTVTLAPGETTKTIAISTINDSIDEPTKSMTVNLSSPINASLSGSANVATGTIQDNDSPAAATSLSWTESSPYLGTTAHATWTVSSSTNRSSQRIQFYSDGSCGTTSGSLVTLSATSDQSYTFSASANQTYTYRITDTDSDGNSTVSACSSSLSIGSPPSGLSYAQSSALYLYNDADASLTTAIAANSPTVTGTVVSYAISPNLTANTGLAFDTSTGVISGKPSVTSAATTYTITAANGVGSATVDISIRTNPGFEVDSNAELSDADPIDNLCSTSSSNCTLRAAITQINAMSGGVNRIIRIPAMTITLSSDLQNFSRSIEVIGASTATTILDGASAFRVFRFAANSLSFTLSDLTVQNAASANAPVIYHGGMNSLSYTISRVKISGSYATSEADSTQGGAININGDGVISDSTFDGNGSTTSGHSQRNLVVCGSSVLIQRSLFINNLTAIVTRCAGLGMIIQNSHFENNTLAYRGILGSAGSLFKNDTFYNNGQAIFGYGTLSNSIIHSSWCNGAGSNGGNLAYNSSGCSGHADDITSADPLLGALQDNGGYTLSRLISASSPARDAAQNSLCTASDQRGLSRPRGGTCDAGSTEY